MKALTKIQLKKVPASQAIQGGDNSQFEKLLKNAQGKGQKSQRMMPVSTANMALLAELRR